MRKNFRHYVKEVTKEVNKGKPPTMKVSESEVHQLLSYVCKNVMTVMNKKTNRVLIERNFLLYTTIKDWSQEELGKRQGK